MKAHTDALKVLATSVALACACADDAGTGGNDSLGNGATESTSTGSNTTAAPNSTPNGAVTNGGPTATATVPGAPATSSTSSPPIRPTTITPPATTAPSASSTAPDNASPNGSGGGADPQPGPTGSNTSPNEPQPNGNGGGGAPNQPPDEGEAGAESGPPVNSDDVAPSAGCSGGGTPESGRFTIDVGGQSREYILAVPDGYDPETPYRLIFGWHPLGGSAQQVAGMGNNGYYGLQSQAAGSAIFVAPEGLPFNGNSLGWGNDQGRDLEFLDAMMARFDEELCFDHNRIFSTGFSFGGMMSFAVGCQMESKMRAIAPQAGNSMVSGCENGDRPVAVMGFHGDDDTVVGIEGGRTGRDVFVERNNCSGETTPLTPSWCEGLGDSNQPCSCVSYEGCDEGYPVIWCEFNGPHTPAPNSGETIWNFFSQF